MAMDKWQRPWSPHQLAVGVHDYGHSASEVDGPYGIDEVRNLVGFIAGAGGPSAGDGASSPYMHWSAVTRLTPCILQIAAICGWTMTELEPGARVESACHAASVGGRDNNNS